MTEGKIDRLTADGAYDRRAVYEEAGRRGAYVVVSPQRGVVISGIRFFGRETDTSSGSLASAERSGDARKGNTAKREPRTLSIDTKESSDQAFGLAIQWLNEMRCWPRATC